MKLGLIIGLLLAVQGTSQAADHTVEIDHTTSSVKFNPRLYSLLDGSSGRVDVGDRWSCVMVNAKDRIMSHCERDGENGGGIFVELRCGTDQGSFVVMDSPSPMSVNGYKVTCIR